MKRHMFDVDYMSIGYGPTHQKLIQDIMKCSNGPTPGQFWAKIGIFTKSSELEAPNDELNGKKRIYC